MGKRLSDQLFTIVFEADTRGGRLFNVAILVVILLSIFLVMLESIPSFYQKHGELLNLLEWGITLILTIEFLLRIFLAHKPWHYLFSFYGVVDLLSVIPTYISIFFIGTHSLAVVRALRLFRVFRLLKLSRYTSAGRNLANAIWASRGKISMFLAFVVTLVTIIGTVMYLIEGEEHGFTSIPISIYWAIVTMTTVGYGDISPATPLGQFIAGFVMIMGYAIIAVPTGLVTAEMITSSKSSQVCPNCFLDIHDKDAVFCKRCGTNLNP